MLVSHRVLNEQVDALREAMAQFGNAPQPGSPWAKDDDAVTGLIYPVADCRAKLLRYARHQAALIYVNAWDHLTTLAMLLGGDGGMSLLSHASVSRVITEAAVRFAWLMAPDIRSEERLVRAAADLQYSADERSKGVRALPAQLFDRRIYQHMLNSCSQEQDTIRKLIDGAGMAFGFARNGREKIRVEMQSPDVAAPLKVNVSERMAEWLPDSPSWYNVGSSVTHSIYWGLRDVNDSRPGEPLTLTPNVLDVGAAVESAISASALILDRCARMYGHDPTAHVQRAQERRAEVDALMRRAFASRWVRIPAEPRGRAARVARLDSTSLTATYLCVRPAGRDG